MDNESRKIDITTLTRKALAAWFEERGLRSFRADQIFKWIYLRQVDDFSQMTDLSKTLRQTLAGCFTIGRLLKERTETSADGTIKYLFHLKDNTFIETVLIPEKDHYTLCVSTQVGCAMDCRFCMTAKGGFIRNLSAAEIIGQVRYATGDVNAKGGMPLTNIVFMGMGEPLANYRNLIQALEVITDGDFGLKISPRRITVSTSGLTEKMIDLGRDTNVNLAVSLNAADDDTRDRLMPINKKFPLKRLMDACRKFPLASRRKITFEYILIKDVNDSLDDADNLAVLLTNVKAKINLIPFNPHEGSEFRRPSEERILKFQDYLINKGYTVLIRKSKGQDISAACGQLRAKQES